MEISLDKNTGQYQITSYAPGVITINQSEYTKPLTVELDNLSQHNLPKAVQEIDRQTLKQLDIASYEAVLLGTGEELKQLSWEVMEAAQMMGAPLEIMSTGAACRTFTVLASEGRQVLAILYP